MILWASVSMPRVDFFLGGLFFLGAPSVKIVLPGRSPGPRDDRSSWEDTFLPQGEQRAFWVHRILFFPKVNNELFGFTALSTPDFLFLKPLLLPTIGPVYWIDSKATCVTSNIALSCMTERLERQFSRYVKLFGPGLVIWRGGFSARWVGRGYA